MTVKAGMAASASTHNFTSKVCVSAFESVHDGNHDGV